MKIRFTLLAFPAFIFLMLAACRKGQAPAAVDLLTITQDSASARKMAEEIKSRSALKLAPGLQIQVWATDSLAPDPVAMDIDAQGNIYLTRTNRQKNSEFDIRGYPHWMTASIALQSVEDRRKFLHETFAPEKSEENKWLTDLNQDSIHDWRDLAVEKEEVWKLEDRDQDGLAEVSTRVINDFNEEVSDILGGILVREKDMFLAIGPDLWHMEDTNGDGVMDKKTSISHGYSVHIGFSGHNMSGVIEGPDGKIYWNIGDIGASITDVQGNKYHHPNEGMILRSNPDGSNFEVYASGLRNTHEFVFDEYGNLISSDNDGDHRGERERLVHIVEGSDAGWRSNWQYGKYTDPKNNGYKVWMDERLSVPRWEGQAAYIIPPIQNFHNGPTGMVYNPGTALGSEWLKKFFLVEFVGNPASSHIWAFSLKPKGASFDLDTDLDMVSGFLPTGIRFGVDGALYAADWVNGWNTKNYGRVWKIDVAEDKNDLKVQRAETRKLIGLKYGTLDEARLETLLKYPDMRVRLKAQFELARRDKKGYPQFKNAIAQKESQLARVHGIWGIGQLLDKNKGYAQDLIALLTDPDEEIIAQALKVLGDRRIESAGETMIPFLKHANPRIRFFAAQSLGRIKHQPAQDALIELLRTNADEDVYIRHASVLALTRLGNASRLASLASDSSRAVRIGGVLALRRLKSPEIRVYLKDQDEYVATEAARGINDDESIPAALPDLAEMVNQTAFKSEPLLRRAINACLRVGEDRHLDMLIAFAQRSDISNVLKAEAMSTIGTWANPSVLDRVDGRYRGEIKREETVVRQKIGPKLKDFLSSSDPDILIATSKMIAELQLAEHASDLESIFVKNDSADVRVAALNALEQIKATTLAQLIPKGMKDPSPKVRAAALGMLDKIELSGAELGRTVNEFLSKGSPREQQRLMGVLGKLPITKTESILSGLIEDLKAKKLPAALGLELKEAIEQSGSAVLMDKLKAVRSGNDPMGEYTLALEGGNPFAGYRYFNESTTGQCIRCHTVNGAGSNVGPDLSKIGSTLTREQILKSLVDPSARLAPGYGVVVLTLKDGSEVYGKLDQENEKELVIITSDAEPLRIATERIRERKNIPSSMPVMTDKMTMREMRDVVEFLATRK